MKYSVLVLLLLTYCHAATNERLSEADKSLIEIGRLSAQIDLESADRNVCQKADVYKQAITKLQRINYQKTKLWSESKQTYLYQLGFYSTLCDNVKATALKQQAENFNKEKIQTYVERTVRQGTNRLKFAAPMPDRNGLFNMETGALITDAEIKLVSHFIADGMTGKGAEVYQGTCSACHGDKGEGIPFVAPTLNDPQTLKRSK